MYRNRATGNPSPLWAQIGLPRRTALHDRQVPVGNVRLDPTWSRTAYDFDGRAGGVLRSPAHRDRSRALAPAITLLCQVGLGPPTVRVWVQGSAHSVVACGAGRGSVVVSAGLVTAVQDGQLPQDQEAALMARAAGLVRAGLVRSDLLIRFWTLP